MRTIERDGVCADWPDRARAKLWPSRLHDLAPTPKDAETAERAIARVAELLEGVSARGLVSTASARVLDAARASLVRADPESFDRAIASIGSPGSPRARSAWASVLTSHEAWTREAAEHYLARGGGRSPLIELFGAFVTDAALSHRLVVASVASPYGLRARAYDLAAHLGPAAMRSFEHMLFERWSDASVTGVAGALALFDAEAAGRALLPLLGSRSLGPIARSWARRHAERAIPILRALAGAPTDRDLDMAQRPELASVVEPLLRALAPPSAPREPWPSDAPSWTTQGPLLTPTFMLLERLPRLATLGGAELPASAGGRWLERVARREGSSAGIDEASLSAFSCALYRAWREHPSAPSDRWVPDVLAAVIDEATVDEIAGDVEPTHRAGRASRAARLLDILASRGTTRSLFRIDELARTSRYRALRRNAHAALTRAASERALDVEALADRSVPTCGFDARGERTLSLGARELVVLLDERLEVRVRVDGARTRSGLPASRRGDDPAAYEAAKRAFAELRGEVRRTCAMIALRLERMMIERRAVDRASFARDFVGHPLVRRVVDRLLWSDGERALRVAEDGTLADRDEREVELAHDARMRIVHPIALSDPDRALWSERFADYRITPPFEQLARTVFVPTEDERRTGRALRLEGADRPWERVAELRKHGFEGRSADGIRVDRFERELDRIGRVELEVSPGLHVGSPHGSGPQRIVRASIPRLGELDAVLASEALRALAGLY
ncbi:MAG: DUF4132 domain-containing protein [Sandaracinaceae bacterium]